MIPPLAEASQGRQARLDKTKTLKTNESSNDGDKGKQGPRVRGTLKRSVSLGCGTNAWRYTQPSVVFCGVDMKKRG